MQRFKRFNETIPASNSYNVIRMYWYLTWMYCTNFMIKKLFVRKCKHNLQNHENASKNISYLTSPNIKNEQDFNNMVRCGSQPTLSGHQVIRKPKSISLGIEKLYWVMLTSKDFRKMTALCNNAVNLTSIQKRRKRFIKFGFQIKRIPNFS